MSKLKELNSILESLFAVAKSAQSDRMEAFYLRVFACSVIDQLAMIEGCESKLREVTDHAIATERFRRDYTEAS